jgi:DNA replication and repair protein RecF
MMVSSLQSDAQTLIDNGLNHTILSVSKLQLSSYRNFTQLNLELSDIPVIITGNNGVGKTNILEAISFLTPGRGLRNAKLNEIDSKNTNESQSLQLSKPWQVSAIVTSVYGLSKIVTGRASGIDAGSNKRIVKINEQLTKGHTELISLFNVLWLTPQMDQIFNLSSSVRRRFLDRLVYNFDAEHAKRLTSYEHYTKERLKLLKMNRSDSDWLTALECNMAETGVAIAAARVQAAGYIQEAIYNLNDLFPKARLRMQGDIESRIEQTSALQLEEEFKIKLRENRKLDSIVGRTNYGVHRSDLQVYHIDKKTEAALCSTGEQKALLLSIILAEALAKVKWRSLVPVILLDEVVAHLDSARREALFEIILSLRAQTWITGTDVSQFESLQGRAQFLAIN